ncbi:DegT/DnrJ/EryC1/StrS family aminotransferase [Robertmurraya andreesenii]|uniref:dTDP-4-amino-4,6-dideoxygalactose transaminase n=1 Tax=Anoxybacillus andreesenii TaxID=1325932 RepID=A0ABT9V361_9BACL|nr:DegT/DnrJ/EryC1/StrS family aminotransferase [Robertmurraya andreesenii]MDQ0155374.1 dTDP-4-amino-4,6-dideoxygalactose transaminase [Robertmurraya andreesenii]
MIPVSQPFLPPKDEYDFLITELWNTKWLTNNGPFVQRLEVELRRHLLLPSLHYVSNGTIALQLALKSLGLTKEIITTPFSFVATTTSILWEQCRPVFVDIDPQTLCIDSTKIEAAITEETEAILATHVFGIPCDVEKIEEVATKYGLKIIYDAAHAFGVQYKGRSLLSYGDIAILSFHATKLFHTIEGGAVVNNCGQELEQSLKLLRSFGFTGEEHILVGINGKNSEFHAAMGLCNLKYIEEIILKRKRLSKAYDDLLLNRFARPHIPEDVIYNYSYYPLIFETEEELLSTQCLLRKNGIESRRYFYPSLNELPYLQERHDCPISEKISKRILCLPLFSDLKLEEVDRIATLILEKEMARAL